MELKGRTAVVTGGSIGIGAAVAARLARLDCRVAICARTEKRLNRTAAELRTEGHEVVAFPCDVSREDSVEEFAAHVLAALGPADILVNNAGIGIFGYIGDLSADDFDAVFGANVRGLFLCTRAFVPDMIRRQDGVIVNIASLAGKNAFKQGTVYAASKHAVIGMSRCLMLELREHNIRVLTVCPGSVDTAFFDRGGHVQPDRARILRPSDVAQLIVSAIELSDRGTVSEIDIRPTNP